MANTTQTQAASKQGVRMEILPGYIGAVVVSVALMLGMMSLQPLLESNKLIFDFYPAWLEGSMEGNLFYRIMWMIGDSTEGAFLKSVPAGVVMILCTFIGFNLEKKGSKYAGTGVGGNARVFPQMMLAALAGLIITQIVYTRFFATGWVPSFTPMCSVAPALILTFGGKKPSKVATAAVLAGLVPFPIAYFLMTQMTDPLGLPGFVAGAFGMAFATVISSEICRRLPWMMEPDPAPAAEDAPPPPAPVTGHKLFFRRLFADSNELVFWGSSWGGLGMYAGAILAWLLNPFHGSYGSGAFPVMMCAQMLTIATAIFVYYPVYKRDGFAFSFTSLVNTAAIVNTYGTDWRIILPTILVSALVLPPLVGWILGFIKYDGRWHVCAFALSCIGMVCIFWSFFVMKVLMPLFGLA